MKKTFAIPDAAMPYAGFTSRHLATRAVRSPPGLSIDPNSGTVSPTADADSPYSVAVDAADSITGTDDPQTFNWTVSPVTVSLSNPGDQTNYDADTVSLQLSASDSASHDLSYSVTGGALPAGLSLNSSGLISGTIGDTADTGSVYSVTITATDSPAEASDTQTFNWTVNNPVALTNPGDQTNFDGDTGISLQLSASDADGNSVTYSITSGSLPSGLSLNTSTGLISGDISNTADTGSPYSITVTASDSVNTGVTNAQTFSWYVSAVTVTLDNPSDQTNCDGDVVSLTLPRSDSANNPLTFAATNLPEGLSIDPDTGEISGTISSDGALGAYSVTVTATDSIANVSASQTFNWNIVSIMIENPGNQYDKDGDTADLTLQTETSYAATDTFAYSETGLPPGLSIDSGTGEISGTIASTADTGSPYSVTVTVTDSDAGVNASQTFTWTVAPNVVTVSLANPGTQKESDGQAVSLTLMGLDSIGDPLNYSASGLPPGLSVVANQITGTIAAGADTSSPYNVTITATDADTGTNASQTFAWDVKTARDTVSLANPGNQTDVDESSVDLSLTASDSTGDPLTYGATGLPPGLSIDSDTGEITGTVDEGDFEGGPYDVHFTATDEEAGVDACQEVTWFCAPDASESALDASTTYVTSSVNPSSFGQSITLTATVVGDYGTPTGTATFMDGTNNLGTFNLTNGVATLPISTLGIGNHVITAVYNGSTTYERSTSQVPVEQTVTGGTVAGQVWVDANSNGLIDSGETGFTGGATVNLLNTSGGIVATTTADGAGMYSFNTLLPSTYYAIQVEAPAGYTFTIFQVGNNPSVNSATGGSDGITNYFQVAVGASLVQNSGLINLGAQTTGTISGPATVPGDSQYTYLLVLNGQQQPNFSVQVPGKTNPANYYSVSGLPQQTYNSATNVTLLTITITFANNPVIINLNAYVCGQLVSTEQICVVQVLVSDPQGGAQAFTPGTPQDVAMLQPGNVTINGQVMNTQLKLVASGVPVNPGVNPQNPGLGWQAVVTLVGPNDNQGVNMIQVGFIQHATWNTYSGSYGGNNTLVSPLPGQSAVDIFGDANPQPPWYTVTTGWNGRQPTFFNATQGTASATIASFDTPGVALPSTYAGNSLQGINYLATFTLDVAVETTDSSNGANLSYWGEARASWSFNGTGTVAANTFTWTRNGAGVTVNPNTTNPNSWVTNTPTTLMPETYGGSTANQLFNEGKFNSP